MEEFIEGHEGFLDTLTIRGEVVHEFISHYYPNVLEAMRERWISPQIVSTNRIDAPGYAEVKLTGAQGDQGARHRHARPRTWSGSSGPRGSSSPRSAAARPGVGQWDVYNAGNDFDIYREWAMALVHGRIGPARLRAATPAA